VLLLLAAAAAAAAAQPRSALAAAAAAAVVVADELAEEDGAVARGAGDDGLAGVEGGVVDRPLVAGQRVRELARR
jgi:hypothetical protein